MEARNVIGFSSYSSSLSVLAAIVPAAPTNVQTINQDGNVIVSWTPPSTEPIQDYGDDIIGYKIYI